MGDVTMVEDIPQFLRDDLDALWVLLGAILVFFMQCGFALLEAGTVQEKSAKNILLKNVLDACIGAMLWWSLGHSFAYGEGGSHPNGFIGGKNFFTSEVTVINQSNVTFYTKWIFSWTFASTSATIVSGAVAERCRFVSYIIYTSFMTGLIYPVVVHWAWSKEGWLSPFRLNQAGEFDPVLGGMGMLDFAGSGVVHVTGGGAALVGAYIIGPRSGRFQADGKIDELKGHSAALATLGTFILWFGWYGFNTASTQCMVGCMDVAAKIAVTTTISAASSGLTVLLVNTLSGSPADVSPILNGILAGLVSITSSCAFVEPYSACVIGAIGSMIYYSTSKLLKKLHIDDPLDASPVHFFCGIWGVIAAGIFATENGVKAAYRRDEVAGFGFLYGSGGSQFGNQLLGVLAIAAWTLVLSSALFMFLLKTKYLRSVVDGENQVLAHLGVSVNGGNALTSEVEMVTTSTEQQYFYRRYKRSGQAPSPPGEGPYASQQPTLSVSRDTPT